MMTTGQAEAMIAFASTATQETAVMIREIIFDAGRCYVCGAELGAYCECVHEDHNYRHIATLDKMEEVA